MLAVLESNVRNSSSQDQGLSRCRVGVDITRLHRRSVNPEERKDQESFLEALVDQVGGECRVFHQASYLSLMRLCAFLFWAASFGLTD